MITALVTHLEHRFLQLIRFHHALSLRFAISSIVDRIFNKWPRLIRVLIFKMRQVFEAFLETTILNHIKDAEIVLGGELVVYWFLLLPGHWFNCLWTSETNLVHFERLAVIIFIWEGHFDAEFHIILGYDRIFDSLGKRVSKEIGPADDIHLLVFIISALMKAIRFLLSCIHICTNY